MDKLLLSLFSLLHMGGGPAARPSSSRAIPFGVYATVACVAAAPAPQDFWFWRWCMTCKPRVQLFHVMKQTVRDVFGGRGSCVFTCWFWLHV